MGELAFRPADEVPFDDVQTVLGRSAAGRCQCQRQVLGDAVWWYMPVEERRMRLAEQTCADGQDSPTTSGLVAYEDGEPIGGPPSRRVRRTAATTGAAPSCGQAGTRTARTGPCGPRRASWSAPALAARV